MTASSVQMNSTGGTRLATNSYTDGGVTVHDEKVILGEPNLPTYVIAPGAAVSVATANDHILQIMAGASLNVYLRRLRIWQRGLATTAAIGDVQLFSLSTAGTGGTALNVSKADSTDAAAGATAMSLPTAKGTEVTRFMFWTHGYIQTVPTSGVNTVLVDLDFDKMLRSKGIRIAAGTTNGIAIKHVTAIAAASVVYEAWISEASY